MKYMNIGGRKTSVIALGAFGLGGGKTWSDTRSDTASVADLLDAAYDNGINLIDTAPVYGLGHSEELLSEALRTRRSRFYLSTKCALNWRDSEGALEYERDGKRVFRNLTAASIKQDVEDSLRRLKTDHIDIIITHRQTDSVPVEETMGALMDLKQEGKICGVGISQASPAKLRSYAAIGPVDLVQEKFSILDPGAKEFYFDACADTGTAFQVFSSLEKGALTPAVLYGTVFPEGDIRARLKWFQPQMRPYMEALFAGWQPLVDKYNCSLTNLVQAWTMAQTPLLNLLTGLRKIENLLDTVKAADLSLEKADIDQMTADARKLIEM